MTKNLFAQIQSRNVGSPATTGVNAPSLTCVMMWIDTMPVKMIVADAAGKAEFFNKQWYTYTGLPLQYPKNKMWKAALHADDIQRTFNAMAFSVATGEDMHIEYRLKQASSEQYRWHLCCAAPIRDDNGGIIKWVVTVTDIHDQKEAEHKKDIFLSVASHELKTPLTTLKTLIHLYKSEIIADNDACPNVLEQAENQLVRIERLLGNLLDVSKINSNKMVYRFEEFNFGEMVAESCERMQQQNRQHNIVLQQNTRVLFTGDKLSLEQVMNNLLSNAIKYSPAGSRIIVRSYVHQNELYVSVQDYGIGIHADNLQDIFTAYYRVNSASSGSQGLGIGLYVCSEIIKSHIGKIWVQSTPGKGSVFLFRLPISQHTFSPESHDF